MAVQMQQYPTVFLSHSHKDKPFIEKLAIDLRKHRIHAWYDEWEIPAGSSLRETVFDRGIAGCNAFLVYLTPHSLKSKWVSEEMNSAFVKMIEDSCIFIPAISNNALIDSLSPDLQAKRILLLNEAHYSDSVLEILATILESYYDKRVADTVALLDQMKKETLTIREAFEQKLQSQREGDNYHISRLNNELQQVKQHLLRVYKAVQQLIAPSEFRNIVRLPPDVIEEREISLVQEIYDECPACFGTDRMDKRISSGPHDEFVDECTCKTCGHRFRITDGK